MYFSYWRKIRLVGWRGVVRYFVDRWQKRQQVGVLMRKLACAIGEQPIPGFTLLFDVAGKASLCKTMRDFAIALKRVGIPVQIVDTAAGGVKAPVPSEVVDLVVDVSKPRLVKYSQTIEMFPGLGVCPVGSRHSTVVFCEFDTGLRTAHPTLAKEKSFIGMSDFCVDVLKKDFPKANVSKVVYPFRFAEMPTDEEKHEMRRRVGLADADFAVFYNFDFGSSCFRKNPEGALRAFIAGLGALENTRLVFKTMNMSSHWQERDKLVQIAADAGVSNKVVFIDDYLTQKELYALTGACDVYLSLHRGEGFGLGIAEAMYLGLPVVVSDCSAPREFCKPDNSMLVPCERISVNGLNDHASYTEVRFVWNPNEHAAADALRVLYESQEMRRAIGKKASDFIKIHFSDHAFKSSVEGLLSDQCAL